ncbi:MAG: uroporphyrinogen decarboxylase family protein [Planctomycetota bacterium]|jgi:uroporphyrinogen decarboxylase|nr:uroporphyrinogen decarboxylase family protein [Planctomycetota bacterium]
MLNAYRGEFSDRDPVAPEFWYYYPAKVLGVDMIEFQTEVTFWKALQTTFKKFQTEGWGVVFPAAHNPHVGTESTRQKVSEGRFHQVTVTKTGGRTFQSVRLFDKEEPSWTVERPVKDEADLLTFIEPTFSPDVTRDFSSVNQAHEEVGEDYLLELWLGVPFFDFVGGAMGFEKSAIYFMKQDAALLRKLRERYTERQLELVRKACAETPFESFCIGCSCSNNSLIGPRMWRAWDKPYIQAIADEVHRHGRLLHVHFHGRCIETVADFAEIGIDCVCPFERPPGGDVSGLEGLREVRRLLAGKVTMNGNIHTVETLIRGNPEKVRQEVREIKEAYRGEPRLIIGTGDQVGKETPEENIWAMIEEAKLSE